MGEERIATAPGIPGSVEPTSMNKAKDANLPAMVVEEEMKELQSLINLQTQKRHHHIAYHDIILLPVLLY